MGKYEKYEDIPKETLDRFNGLETDEEKALAFANAEKASVDNKKSKKEIEKEYEGKFGEMQKQIDKLSENGKKSELDIFLKDKKMSEDEKKAFDEKLDKGYSMDDAYKLATLDGQKQEENQEEINNNVFEGNDKSSKSTISTDEYNKLAENATNSNEDLEKFQNIDTKVSSGDIKIV